MRILGIVLVCALLGACTSAPIKVADKPDIAAVRVQNETTKKHIESFASENTKTRGNVQKIKEEHAAEGDLLQSVMRDLEELLK